MLDHFCLFTVEETKSTARRLDEIQRLEILPMATEGLSYFMHCLDTLLDLSILPLLAIACARKTL